MDDIFISHLAILRDIFDWTGGGGQLPPHHHQTTKNYPACYHWSESEKSCQCIKCFYYDFDFNSVETWLKGWTLNQGEHQISLPILAQGLQASPSYSSFPVLLLALQSGFLLNCHLLRHIFPGHITSIAPLAIVPHPCHSSLEHLPPIKHLWLLLVHVYH